MYENLQVHACSVWTQPDRIAWHGGQETLGQRMRFVASSWSLPNRVVGTVLVGRPFRGDRMPCWRPVSVEWIGAQGAWVQTALSGFNHCIWCRCFCQALGNPEVGFWFERNKFNVHISSNRS